MKTCTVASYIFEVVRKIVFQQIAKNSPMAPTTVTKDAVTQLKELHEKKALSKNPPKYDIVPQGNPPNLFFEATCSYCDDISRGLGQSKSKAKEASAGQMLEILNENTTAIHENLLSPILRNMSCNNIISKTPTSKPNLKYLTKTYSESPVQQHLGAKISKQTPGTFPDLDNYEPKLNETQIKKANSFLLKYQKKESLSIRFEDFLDSEDVSILSDTSLGLKKLRLTSLNSLKTASNYIDASKINYVDAIDHFKTVMKEMEREFYIVVPPMKSEKNLKVVFLHTNYRNILAGGNGKTLENAVYMACNNLINTLLVLSE